LGVITLRVAAAALLATVVTPVMTPASAATPSVRTAYWWQPEPVSGLIPAPGVPAAGLYVASSPAGTQAMSALSITTPISSGLVQLTLQVSQRQVLNPPAISAYAATSSWQPGGPQPWASRPRYAHALARGDYNPAQTRMSLRVPAFALAHGIVLVPSAVKGATIGPTFAISFQRPVAASVRASSSPTPNPGRHSSSPRPSRSNRPSAHPASSKPTPTHTPHHPRSASPHPRHTAKPGSPIPSHSPGRTPGPTPTTRTAAPSGSGHEGLVIGIAAAAAAVIAAGAALTVLRRRGAPPG
jgi:hypothetical protein